MLGKCAEFPSLSWLAKGPESALKGIQKLVAEADLIVEQGRKRLAAEIQAARKEFAEGQGHSSSVDELMKEILS